MAARKLQTEIDRTLKKVAEGVELFESIYDKMQSSTNQTQKEKSELDLKTQIKKLQRLRDQIKTWVASNDIKDKSALLENRRLIETQMEKFKACEKEMKTKAFSKEGLIQAARLDPKEQEKEEAIQWLNNQVEQLQQQVEGTEAEVEAIQGTGKKRNKGQTNAGRQEELEALNDRRKWHISRLEIVLRMLNNGSLPVEKVNELKEDVDYFVANNSEEGFEEDEGIYEELNLDEEEEKFGLVADDDDSEDSDDASADVPTSRPTKKHDEESVSSKGNGKLNLRTKPPLNLNFAQPMATILKAGLQPKPAPRPAAPAVLPQIGYAAMAAAAVATPAASTSSAPTPAATATTAPSHPPPPASTAPSIPPALAPLATAVQQESSVATTSSPSLTQLSMTSPMLSSAASASQQPDGSFYSGQSRLRCPSGFVWQACTAVAAARANTQRCVNKHSVASPLVTTQVQVAQTTEVLQQPPAQPTTSGQQTMQIQQQQTLPTPGPSPLPQQVQQYAANAPPLSKSPMPMSTGLQQQQLQAQAQAQGEQQQQQQLGPGVSAPTPQQNIGAQRPGSTTQPPSRAGVSAAFPGSLSDLVVSFENVKQKAMRANNLDTMHKLLEGSYSHMPQPQDTEKPKYYVPRNPYQTAPYYPQTPHPLLQTPAIFSQLDVESLFWVFYYLPGTYQQCISRCKGAEAPVVAFHVKYLTWFQRHSEPQAITEEYEQGGSWCQRKKSDFRFEYRYLSED
ncbi:Not1 N-terminal domain, CCR4-Not complex component-domain-containing protein [Pholiota molesta]|nr:Not1 N-terminal domain, CCR4-Not complex component-domain-containing protein [Pholiota molesta]